MRETLPMRLGKLLKHSGSTLSAAESCTGGRISHLLTSVSGASAWYLGSVTSYAVSVKQQLLGVPARLIREHGVVSSEVAAAMAEGVRRVTGSTYSVSTTGLAEGGDERYPEGTVWVGVSGPAGTITREYHCDRDRSGNIRRFATLALSTLENYIKENTND